MLAIEKYGAAGIKLCTEWREDSSVFYKWCLGNGYSDSLTLDRIDNSKGYSPDNCRWTTKSVQSQNSSQSKLNNEKVLEIRELLKTISVKVICHLHGVSKNIIYGIKKGTRWNNVYSDTDGRPHSLPLAK